MELDEGSPLEPSEEEESLGKPIAKLWIEPTGLMSLEPPRKSTGGLPSLGSKFQD
jgi:hypothetical protein